MAIRTNTRVKKPDGRLLQIAGRHEPNDQAIKLGVDIVTDPNFRDEEGFIFSSVSRTRDPRSVLPQTDVVFGSRLGR